MKPELSRENPNQQFQGSNKDEWYKGDFLLDSEADPKRLRTVIRDCPQAGYLSKWAFAIYKLEEGKLTVVGHAPGVEQAPESFAGDATSRTFIFKKAENR